MCVGPEAMMALGVSKASAATAASVASVAMGAMTGFTALGSIQQGRSQNKIAQYNAQIAENQAIAARQKAEYDEERQRTMIARMGGTQRANIAAGGGELLDAGDVLGFSAEEAELDALAIRYGGRMAQTSAQQQAMLQRAQGKSAQNAGYMKAGTTLLTGASNAMMMGGGGSYGPGSSAGSFRPGKSLRDSSGFIG